MGRGRLAHYLLTIYKDSSNFASSAEIPITRQWNRSLTKTFSELVAEFDPTHILLAVSDASIDSFIQENTPDLRDRTCVHFAGSRGDVSVGPARVYSVHPLMTFTGVHRPSIQSIPFALTLESPEIELLLPGFQNLLSFRVPTEKRALYHAYCSIAGNLTVLLWEEIERRFQRNLNLSAQLLGPFRSATFSNLETRIADTSVLTGPIARRDRVTLARQKSALLEANDPSLARLIDAANDLFHTRPMENPK